MPEEPRPALWMCCAVCGYPLERDRNAAGTDREWFHVRATARADHLAVPVEATDLAHINQRCDFCDAPDPAWVIQVHSFDMPVGHQRSIGHWTACGDCKVEVEAGRWGQLATRVKRVGPPATRRATRRYLLALYEAVAAHMFGIISREEWRATATYPLPTEPPR